jgi:hypothetical protein
MSGETLNFETETGESLVDRYAKAAEIHRRATEAGDHNLANTAHQEIAAVYRELRRRGPEAQRTLLPLLASPDIGVRSWAGSHALEFAASEGEPVLIAISEIPKSLVGFDARITLREWREGKLRFP